ncbi:SDR family oxidoreductase [Burkholderia multivorans]|uniref:SDR family NAD(P)-dependent oxidoreductase n=1 Tax=Burkholderia multivorans TaxID=87883 RepID=UPI002B24D9E2|nr:SDR family oxidoreductase [Burkholderia multivorans]MEB2484890.1 SDR family oxidoreductase [Burkholderia multivorans]MEB2566951.1 SDR family oxidoreductase [Burkholderia multivorans]
MDTPHPPTHTAIPETELDTELEAEVDAEVETAVEPRASHVHRPVALVTGSTSGIGAAIARRLAADGYAVILHSLRSVETGRAMATELDAAYVQADLADDAERVRLIRDALAVHGRLDVLINNAGISRTIAHDDLAAATPDVWRELYEINAIAPFRLVAEAQPALLEAASHGRAGCVVNVSSHAGVRPKGASIPYAAAKAALNHTTRLLARTLAPAIRVNAVAPGLVDTPLTADWTDAQQLWRERAPMRRAATPDDVAQTVAMLVASDYVTGEIVMLDGGLNLT